MHLTPSGLIAVILGLIAFSALFSLAEIAVMSVNRYRLRHLERHGNQAAVRISELLARPDRLLGVILISDTFCDLLASSLATMLAVRLLGDIGTLVSACIMTFLVMVFGQMVPKTLAALYPQRIALFAARPLSLVLKLLYPLVVSINAISNGILRLFGIKLQNIGVEHLNVEELRTLVYESGSRIPAGHQNMLLRILDLGKVTVEDVMVPRNEIIGVDIEQAWPSILQQLLDSKHTRLPVYCDEIDQLHGILHIRNALFLHAQGLLNKESLLTNLQEPYFIPENTSLNTQLLNFKETKQRIAFVVDEYGDIRGLVSVEDILQEIVGEFASSNASEEEPEIVPQADGSYLIDGGAYIRDLNRTLHWKLNTDGPKTLSGLIIEYLEFIPEPNVCLLLSGYPIEIIEMRDNMVKSARIFPKLRKKIRKENL